MFLQFSFFQSCLCTFWSWFLCQSWWWYIFEARWLDYTRLIVFNASKNLIWGPAFFPQSKLMFIFNWLSDRLSLLLAKDRNHPQTYIGCMKKGPVINDPKLKWFVPLNLFLLCLHVVIMFLTGSFFACNCTYIELPT